MNVGKFTRDSKKLLEYMGGRKNAAAVSHCVIGIRFMLNDLSKANTGAAGSLSSAKGAFIQAGQFQVIIGNEAGTFYNGSAEVVDIEGASKGAVEKAAVQNRTLIQKIMNSLAEIFVPLIPVIIVGGLTLGFRNIIGGIALFDGGIKTLTQISVFQADINSFLWFIGEVVFYFLPTCVVWSIIKKMGTTQALGIVPGITLVSPRLLNVYSVATTAAAETPKWNFGFFQVNITGYQAQVLPAVLAGLILVYLERSFREIRPVMISMIVILFCSLLISVIVAYGILGPTDWGIGAVISDCVNADLISPFRGVFAGIFGFFYAPLVITGLRHMSNVIDLQLIVNFGGITPWPMITLSNIAQGSTALAIVLLQKSDAKAKEVSVPACISCYLGVTEPATFSVNPKYGFPFICRMAGSAMGVVLFVVSGVKANVIDVEGIPDILSIQPRYMGLSVAATGLVTLIPFCLIYATGRKRGIGGDRENQDEPGHEASRKERRDLANQPIGELEAYVSGEVIPMENTPDQVFTPRALGDGVAIKPEDGVLKASANAMVAIIMEEGPHACGLVLDNGMELLLYIGLDTVDMKGDGSRAFVKPEDRVRVGEELIVFDCEKTTGAGHSDMIIMVLTSPGNSGAINWQIGRRVRTSTDVVARMG